MFEPFEPSTQIESLLTAVARRQAASERMRAMMQREPEFPSPLEAKLTGIALDPYGRKFADQVLDTHWSDGGASARRAELQQHRPRGHHR